MNKTSLEEPLSKKESHALQFPLEDITILQNPSESPCSWLNREALKSKHSALKLAQIISAIVILVLTGIGYIGTSVEIPYMLFTYSVMSVSVVLLVDSILVARPLRQAFTPVLWFRMELLFNGIAGLVYYLLAYYVLIMSIQYRYLVCNIVAGPVGFVCAVLHLLDWWINFSKRRVIIQDMCPKADV